MKEITLLVKIWKTFFTWSLKCLICLYYTNGYSYIYPNLLFFIIICHVNGGEEEMKCHFSLTEKIKKPRTKIQGGKINYSIYNITVN